MINERARLFIIEVVDANWRCFRVWGVAFSFASMYIVGMVGEAIGDSRHF